MNEVEKCIDNVTGLIRSAAHAVGREADEMAEMVNVAIRGATAADGNQEYIAGMIKSRDAYMKGANVVYFLITGLYRDEAAIAEIRRVVEEALA